MSSSPFAAQLGTNYCPQDEELAQINSLLIDPCLRLKRLDDEIAVMQNAINKLNEERDALATYVEAHRALISPVRRLPLDIMEEIFMACLPTHRNCVMSAQEAPIILGRICSSWRTISLSTPRLWSRLHIVEPTRQYGSTHGLYDAKVAQRLEVANTWLRRSGNCPLAISLESNLNHDMTPPLTPSPSPPNTDFLDVLIPFTSRWQNIHLVITPQALETLSYLTEDDVPLLKSLEIVQRPQHPHNNVQWSLSPSGLLHGPSLIQFSFLGSNINSSDLPLRWYQLTGLSFMGSVWGMGHAQTSEVVLNILSRCPQLRTCNLLVHDPPEALSADSIVECSFIHTFELHCVGTPLQTSGHLLSRLSLPNLRDFKLRGEEDRDGVFPADSLVRFITTSTRLESISIDTASFSRSSLKDFLCSLPPTVRRLRITEPSHMWRPSPADSVLDNVVFAALDSSCPALQELAIDHCRKVSDEALRRFIMSRMPVLRRVEVKFGREREVDILPSLESFLEVGLQTSISYTSLPAPLFSPWQGLPDAPPAPWMSLPVPWY
ncbi:hypothetical protein B0H19DRAFT_64294 [Mycena capillaripes]|nr:hypothetical protein B0H19DRAFT_64294 [Mycena capillaripes]